jgi:hypothetical protein
LELASTFQDKEARVILLGFAQGWSRLAHLAQANRHIAELTVQIAAQRAVVKHALETGQGSEMAESLLDALEGSLRIFERHRIFLLSCSALPPGDAATGACHDATGMAHHDRLTNAWPPPSSVPADVQPSMKKAPDVPGL